MPLNENQIMYIDKYMRDKLKASNVKIIDAQTPIIPIYTYEPFRTLTVAKELYEKGVYVNSSLPPATAPTECLLRTSLMATHTEALIDEAVEIIAEVLQNHKLED